eukprot:TRINITY_DN26636_c0_g1_i1.p1 TRINITY_DN26636_c0_g1~~TRINITY_DN26636_c0_g1_i1.p1  ORF type:complete len:134 (-),score=10.34 TRINITY_DN26636_c0_g1_i1:1366-1767(-)
MPLIRDQACLSRALQDGLLHRVVMIVGHGFVLLSKVARAIVIARWLSQEQHPRLKLTLAAEILQSGLPIQEGRPVTESLRSGVFAQGATAACSGAFWTLASRLFGGVVDPAEQRWRVPRRQARLLAVSGRHTI